MLRLLEMEPLKTWAEYNLFLITEALAERNLNKTLRTLCIIGNNRYQLAWELQQKKHAADRILFVWNWWPVSYCSQSEKTDYCSPQCKSIRHPQSFSASITFWGSWLDLTSIKWRVVPTIQNFSPYHTVNCNTFQFNNHQVMLNIDIIGFHYKNLSRGIIRFVVLIRLVVFKFVSWYSNPSRGIQIRLVVFQFVSWYSNSSRGFQIRLRGIQIRLTCKVNSLRLSFG